MHRNVNIPFIIISYTQIVFIIILCFAWMYIADTKSSINGYVKGNFEGKQTQEKFTIIDYFKEPSNYLCYDKMRLNEVFAKNDFDQKKIQDYINVRFAPVNKIEDFIFYSAENCLGGINVGINAEGAKIKYELILQKFLFVLITLVTIVNLSKKSNLEMFS